MRRSISPRPSETISSISMVCDVMRETPFRNALRRRISHCRILKRIDNIDLNCSGNRKDSTMSTKRSYAWISMPAPDDDSDQFCAVERAMEPAAPVEAVNEHRRGFLSCVRCPAGDIEMFGSQHQGSILKAIEIVHHFTAVDVPDLRD